MSYLPYCGYWFYDPAGTDEMHLSYVSWGLLSSAPTPAPVGTRRRIGLLAGVY